MPFTALKWFLVLAWKALIKKLFYCFFFICTTEGPESGAERTSCCLNASESMQLPLQMCGKTPATPFSACEIADFICKFCTSSENYSNYLRATSAALRTTKSLPGCLLSWRGYKQNTFSVGQTSQQPWPFDSPIDGKSLLHGEMGKWGYKEG